MKYYPNDVVRDKQSGKEYEVSHVSTCGNIDLNVDGRFWFTPELASERLQLVRRADEHGWPADVPRCELPLPEGKTRWVNRGRGFISDSRCAYWNHDQWQTTKRGSGIAGYHYAEAVNDEDYTPPQLSETTNLSQVESKITVERPTMVKHADLHNVASVRIDGGKIFTHLNRLSISASQALALAELLTAAAKEAQQ